MKVLQVKKSSNDKFYNVKLENGDKYKFAEDIVVKYHLFVKNKEIDEDELKTIIEDNNYYLALYNSYDYLSYVHSKNEVYNHLIKKYDKKIVLEVLEQLEKLHLINDLEYAKSLLSYACNNGKGKEYYRQELLNQRIQSEVIDEVIDLYQADLEEEVCQKVFLKYVKNLKGSSYTATISKIKNYLISRGFSNNICIIILAKNEQVLDNIINEDKALSLDYKKMKQSLSKKYKGSELNDKLIKKLLAKGYRYDKIKSLIKEV